MKQLLKSRGLSIVGVKSELIQRLESAMLNHSIGDMSTTKEIDEDAILADDDESLESKPDESLLHNEDLLLSESSIDTSSLINKIVSNSTTPAVATSNPDTDLITSASNLSEAINAPTKPNTVSSLKHLATSKNILSSDQKRQMRQLKFADPKVKNRAERFGVAFGKVSISSFVYEYL